MSADLAAQNRLASRIAGPDGTEVHKSQAQQCGPDLCNCRLARIPVQIILLCLSTVHAPTVSRLMGRSCCKREKDGEETLVVTRRLCLASDLQRMARQKKFTASEKQDRKLKGENCKWKTKRTTNAPTFHARVRLQLARSIAAMPVGMRGTKKSRSHANVTT